VIRRVPVNDVRGGKSAAAYVPTTKHSVGIVADGALAVGARHVDGLPRELDILQEQAYPLESRLDHRRTV
jgi:hypothetical protein